MIGELLNMRVGTAKARTAELLDWFDLADAADRMAKTYSGGMRRRLDLAASLTGHPEIVFLDEPTTGLDPAKREDMWDVVRDIVARGTAENLKRVVGSQTLRVRPTEPDSGDAVRAILADVATDGAQVDQPRNGEFSVPVPNDSALTAVVGRLQDASIEVTELSLMLPSLDEVFFTLTGERNRTAPGAPDSTQAVNA